MKTFKQQIHESIDQKIKDLVAKVEKTGRVVTIYPRKKQVSISGGRPLNYQDAIKKMKDILKEDFVKFHNSNDLEIGDELKDYESQVRAREEGINENKLFDGEKLHYSKDNKAKLMWTRLSKDPQVKMDEMDSPLDGDYVLVDKRSGKLLAHMVKKKEIAFTKLGQQMIKTKKLDESQQGPAQFDKELKKVGDTVKILHGTHKGKTGKVVKLSNAGNTPKGTPEATVKVGGQEIKFPQQNLIKESQGPAQSPAAPAKVAGGLRSIGFRAKIKPKFAMLLKDTSVEGCELRLLVTYPNGESILIPTADKEGADSQEELLMMVAEVLGDDMHDIETQDVIKSAIMRATEKTLSEATLSDQMQLVVQCTAVLKKPSGTQSETEMTKVEAIQCLKDFVPETQIIHALMDAGHSPEEVEQLMLLAGLDVSITE